MTDTKHIKVRSRFDQTSGGEVLRMTFFELIRGSTYANCGEIVMDKQAALGMLLMFKDNSVYEASLSRVIAMGSEFELKFEVEGQVVPGTCEFCGAREAVYE